MAHSFRARFFSLKQWNKLNLEGKPGIKTSVQCPYHRTTLSFVCNHDDYPPLKGCEGGRSRGGDKGAIWLESMHVWKANGVGDMPKTKPQDS